MSVPVSAIDGEAITGEFSFIASDPLPPTPSLNLPALSTKDCCSAFSLYALADTSSTDEFKNDRAGILFWFSNAISAATITLQKYNGTWADLTTFSDNSFGTFYPFGFFVNDEGEQFIGYQLNWKDVLTTYGEGSYRVRADITAAIGGTSSQLTPEWCLMQYTPERANKTVRIEYNLSGQLGVTDDTKRRDLGTLDWYNSLRLFGFFGYPTSSYEADYIQYNNGQKVYVEDEQEPEYTLKLALAPALVHNLMRTDVLQADQILITDYNAINADTFIKKAVIKNSDYAPNWNKLKSKLATVEVQFIQEYNNLKKLRC